MALLTGYVVDAERLVGQRAAVKIAGVVNRLYLFLIKLLELLERILSDGTVRRKRFEAVRLLNLALDRFVARPAQIEQRRAA